MVTARISGVEAKDEGSSLGQVKKINFTDPGVTAVIDGGDAEQVNVSIPSRVLRLRLRNETGGTLAKGTLISVLGFSVPESLPLVVVADKDDPTKRPAMGVTTASVPNNTNFEALVVGLLDGLNTSAFSDNDQLVLGDNGAVSRPPPEVDPFTGEIQLLGSVARSDASDGSIYFNLSIGLLPMTAAQFFLVKETGPTGSVSGGEVTRAAGRNVDVAAGSGFVNDNTDVFRVTWSAVTNLLLAASDTSFVFVDKNGTVQSSVSPPSTEDNIVLADAITDATTIVLLANHRVRLEEVPAQFHDYAKDVVGPITVNGINTTKAATALRLDVAAGTFYTRSFRATVGATAPITFTYWFRDGSGGFTRAAGSTTIDPDFYDDGSGTLAALPATKWKKDLLFVVSTVSGTVEYHVFYAQEFFDSQSEAEAGALPAADSDVLDNGIQSGAPVVLSGDTIITTVVDVRPFLGQLGPGTTAVTDHGLLGGLGDDDHTQYQLRSEEDVANGYAGLDGSSLLAASQVPDGADATAIHDDTAGEINAIAVKATPVSADVLVIEDSAAAFAKKKVTLGSLPGGGTVTHTITIALETLAAIGNGKEKFRIQVPEAGWTLVEVAGKLRVAGTSFTIQIREIENDGTDNGDVLSIGLAFFATDNAQTTGFVGGRTTPAKNVHYALDIDVSSGAPAGLALQMRFTK